MDNIEINRTWILEKGDLKSRLDRLTDHDLLLEESKNEEMFLRLQAKLGKTKEELHKLLSEILFTSYNLNKSES